MKTVSFDLDGTLADKAFDDALWFKSIPKFYATKQGMSFEEALEHCKRAYDSEGDESLRWYDINHWLAVFGLTEEKPAVLKETKHLVTLFSDAIPCLERLRGASCRLAIVSNASREFISFKLEAEELSSYFKPEDVYSMTSDFKIVKKNAEAFKSICVKLGVEPNELWHAGDHYKFDYLIPREAGVNAFYLDRSCKEKGDFIVRDLNEFAGIVLDA